MQDDLKLGSQICFPIHVLAREINNHYRPLLDELGLTYPQYLVLMVLCEEGPQRVGQLGEQLCLDTGTLTPLLKRMEAKQLLTRTRCTKDERIVLATLTERGKAMMESAKNIPHKMAEVMNVSEDDLLQLKEIVTKILNR